MNARSGFVGDALRRLGKRQVADPEIVPAQKSYDYRTKLTLAVSVDGRHIGLHPYERAGQVFRPRLQLGRVQRVAHRPDLEDDGVQLQVYRFVEDGQQLRLLFRHAQARSRWPVNIPDRRHPRDRVGTGSEPEGDRDTDHDGDADEGLDHRGDDVAGEHGGTSDRHGAEPVDDAAGHVHGDHD